MRTIRHIFIALCIACVAWCIAQAGAEWYIDQLKESGGMVTARDLVGAQFIPWSAAILVFIGYLKLTLE
jgi:hypothetical protein